MTGTTLIAVGYKDSITDPVAHGLLETVRHLDLPKPKRVVTSQLFRLQGDLTDEERERIARDLLCDPVIQEVQDVAEGEGSVAVDIWYKAGVTDVSGDSVSKGIRDLGIRTVSDVRTGMRYRFWGLKNKHAATALASALLANTLVQDVIVHAD